MIIFTTQVINAGIFDKITENLAKLTFKRRGSSGPVASASSPSSSSWSSRSSGGGWGSSDDDDGGMDLPGDPWQDVWGGDGGGGGTTCNCNCGKGGKGGKGGWKDKKSSTMALTIPKYQYVDVPMVKDIPWTSLGQVEETEVGSWGGSSGWK